MKVESGDTSRPGREGVQCLGPLSPASSPYLRLSNLPCLRHSPAAQSHSENTALRVDAPVSRRLRIFLLRMSHSGAACDLTTSPGCLPHTHQCC